MSRRLAHRPRHHLVPIQSRALNRSRRDYLHQRWNYRQQYPQYPQTPLGYSLSLVPWGWKRAREMLTLVKREA
jgi:hypothetical protein